MKQLIFFCFTIIFFSFGFAYADGTLTGTLQGHSAGQGYDYFTLKNSLDTLPGNTVFEGGAVNGTVYSCTYVGPQNAKTSANCKIKTEVVKGHLNDNTIIDINDADNVLAVLPASTTYTGGQTNGAYYLCNYTGTLPNISTARCSLNAAATPATSVGGYRLFANLSCENSSQPLTCFTKAIFSWSQVAIIVLAVGAIVVAGIIYMTSAGNPKRIETSKKLIMGALTGVAVMVLGRLFLTKVVGVSWPLIF
jgi:hypothetical protein